MTAEMIEMPDGVRLRTWTTGSASPNRLPILMLHGGPGVPDYLEPVAACVDDTWLVHRYDQRGVGGSAFDGPYTIDQVIADAISLMDHWGHEQVTLVGHSFGTNLASYITLAHPDRVAGLVHLAGPFLGTRWREAARAVEKSRRSPAQQQRFEDLKARENRTDDEERELIALQWFTDHADQTRAWDWAMDAAGRAVINWEMNTQLNAAKRVVPLEDQLDELRALQPQATTIIAGVGDSRPVAELRVLADQLGIDLVVIEDAGHDPWLEKPDEFRHHLRAAVARQDLVSS